MYVLRKRSRRVGTFLDENLDFLRNSDKRKNVSTDWGDGQSARAIALTPEVFLRKMVKGLVILFQKRNP